MFEALAWEVLFPILGTIVTAAVAWVSALLVRKFNIQITTAQADTIHKAMMTGIRIALQRAGVGTGVGLAVGDLAQDQMATILRDAVDYAKTTGAKDSIAKLKVPDAALIELALAALDKAQTGTDAVAR